MRDLVGAHHQQFVLSVKDAVAGEDVQQGVLGKEGAGEINQIRNCPVCAVSPEVGELEAVAALFSAWDRARLLIVQMFFAGGVGVVLGMRAVGEDKELHVFKQPRAAPEAFAVVAIDLVEGFTQGNAAAFELHVHHRKSVDQNGHIVARWVFALGSFILVKHLEAVVVDGAFIKQVNVLVGAVVAPQDLDIVVLDLASFLDDAFPGIGDLFAKEALPLAVREADVVEGFQLHTQVVYQGGLVVELDVFVALSFNWAMNSRSRSASLW